MPKRNTSTYGFKKTGALLEKQIRRAGETRGFAVSRVLTQWEDIAGSRIAKCARPVEISYGRAGFGATLTLLTTGAHAPMLEMQKETLRQKVNAAYGYDAIARVRITQTAATGFQEGKVDFSHQTKPSPAPTVIDAKARETADGVGDAGLRQALEQLGANVLAKAAPQSRRQ
jgi:hypothetical protein